MFNVFENHNNIFVNIESKSKKEKKELTYEQIREEILNENKPKLNVSNNLVLNKKGKKKIEKEYNFKMF